MANYPLVILGSARRQSSTKKGVELLFRNQPHQVINLLDFPVEPYQYSHHYTYKDRFLAVIERVLEHEVILFATPVYWYAMSGLLKTFFDRLTDLITIRKDLGRSLQNKKVFLVAVGADEEIPPGFTMPFKLTAEYLQMHYIDYIYIPISRINSSSLDKIIAEAFLQKVKDYSE